MLVNLPELIFLSLLINLLVFFYISKRDYYQVHLFWLMTAALFLYSWWNPDYLSSSQELAEEYDPSVKYKTHLFVKQLTNH